jgi:hypothetical protein
MLAAPRSAPPPEVAIGAGELAVEEDSVAVCGAPAEEFSTSARTPPAPSKSVTITASLSTFLMSVLSARVPGKVHVPSSPPITTDDR